MIQYVWRRLSTASSQVLENNKVKEFEGTNQGLESKQMSKRGHFCIIWSWQLKPGSFLITNLSYWGAWYDIFKINFSFECFFFH